MDAIEGYVYGDDVLVPAHLNFGKYLLNRLQPFNDEVALERGDTGEKITYSELKQYAIDVYLALRELGVQKGDVVALGLGKCNEFIPTVLGINLVGAIYTPFELNVGNAVLKHKLLVSKPKYLICTTEFWNKYSEILKSVESVHTYIASENNADWAVTIKQLKQKNGILKRFEPAEVKGQMDTAIILYSSGTTGMPKGVELTHLNCILNSLPIDFSDTSLITAFSHGHWYHNYDIFIGFKLLSMGKKIVYVEDTTPEEVLKCIEAFQVNAAFITPTTINALLKFEPKRNYDIDNLYMIYARSSALHVKTIEKVKKRFPKLKKLLQGYGMTEAGELTSETWVTKELKAGSIGMATPGIILKVVDPTSRKVLGPNQHGEICVKGPALMKGYIDVERSLYLDDEGFLMTGDLGYYDEDKYFYIVDRLKDIINCEGLKIAPLELEHVLLQHPDILDVAAIGKDDPNCIQKPMAFVVKKPGSNVTEKDIVDFVAPEVSPMMQLTGGVKFIQTIPRNQRGKILRRQLKEMLNGVTANGKEENGICNGAKH